MPIESHLSPAGKDTYGIAHFVRYLLKLIMITEIFQFSELTPLQVAKPKKGAD